MKNRRRLTAKAYELEEEGRFRDAIAIWDELIKKYVVSALYFKRGSCYLNLREIDKAVIDFTDGIGLDDTDPDLFVNRGNAYLKLGALEAALDDYTHALALSPNRVYALNGRGQTHADLGNLEEAVRDFQAAIQIDEKYVSPLFNLGILLWKNGQIDSALAYFDRAVELDPQDEAILCARGDLLKVKRDEYAALRTFRDAVRYNPKSSRALRSLSYMLSTISEASHRDPNEAISHGAACCELTAYRDSYCLATLARAHAAKGDFDEAARWETEAIRWATEAQQESKARKRLALYQTKKCP